LEKSFIYDDSSDDDSFDDEPFDSQAIAHLQTYFVCKKCFCEGKQITICETQNMSDIEKQLHMCRRCSDKTMEGIFQAVNDNNSQ